MINNITNINMTLRLLYIIENYIVILGFLLLWNTKFCLNQKLLKTYSMEKSMNMYVLLYSIQANAQKINTLKKILLCKRWYKNGKNVFYLRLMLWPMNSQLNRVTLHYLVAHVTFVFLLIKGGNKKLKRSQERRGQVYKPQVLREK